MGELELPEIKELEETARENKRVGLLISVLAILLAICGALGRKSENFEIVARVNASNTWAYFQAKKLRSYQSETINDVIALIGQSGSGAQKALAGKLTENYRAKLEHYENDAKEISEKAEAYTTEAEKWELRANRFGLGEIFLQIAVVLCSVAILTRLRAFVYGGLGFAAIGFVLAVSALAL